MNKTYEDTCLQMVKRIYWKLSDKCITKKPHIEKVYDRRKWGTTGRDHVS